MRTMPLTPLRAIEHMPPGTRVVSIASGGNVDLEQLRGRVLN